MLVYVTAGGPIPPPKPFVAAFCKFLSRTNVLRLCVACAMFTGREGVPEYEGVAAPSVVAPVARAGVDAPELFCVARTEASLRCDSEIICFVFLFLRPLGFHA